MPTDIKVTSIRNKEILQRRAALRKVAVDSVKQQVRYLYETGMPTASIMLAVRASLSAAEAAEERDSHDYVSN